MHRSLIGFAAATRGPPSSGALRREAFPLRTALTLGLLATLAAAASAATGDRPDETALRYYAGTQQRARVAAETERLHRRHPGWQPPADLWTLRPGGEDEDLFWDLLSAGRSAELDAALAARAAAEPGWKPSPGLAEGVALRGLRDEALGLAKAERWQELADLAARRRPEVEAAGAEVIWAAAEAFGRSEREAEALALLRIALSGGRLTAEERRVSLLRVLPLLPMAEIDRLAAASDPAELEPIRTDLIRGRIAAVLHDEAGQVVTAADLSAFTAYAEAAADPNQPALVAWLALKRRDLPEALAWFKRAMARGGDAMVAHGLAHTLRRMGLRREAEEVAYAWREPLVNNALLFIDLLESDLTRPAPPPVEAARLARYAEVTLANASGEGAQALAWYAYNTCQFETALGWFRRAAAWYPKEATVFGYALALRRMRQERAFVEVVNRYDGLFPKVVGLLFQPAADRPLPCEGARPPRPAERASVYLDLTQQPPSAPLRGRVPAPEEVGEPRAAPPLVRRSDFPVMVNLENDLRAAASGSAAPAPPVPERGAGRAPTTARRVPGVGPMPYERYGFALLPGWTGSDASGSSAADRPAPAGTLWAEERAGPAETGAIDTGPTARRTAP